MPDTTVSKAILIGGGQFARELLSWVRAANAVGRGPEVIGYVDDAGPAMEGFSGDVLPYLGALSDVGEDGIPLLFAVGDPASKKRLFERFGPQPARYASVIHPSAVVTDTALLGPGAIIGPHCYVANHARLGALVAVNSFSGIGHDVQLGAFCTVSSGVDLMGGVTADAEVFFGSGARVLPGVKVGERAKIGAGSIVVRTVKPGQTLYAAPAKTL